MSQHNQDARCLQSWSQGPLIPRPRHGCLTGLCPRSSTATQQTTPATYATRDNFRGRERERFPFSFVVSCYRCLILLTFRCTSIAWERKVGGFTSPPCPCKAPEELLRVKAQMLAAVSNVSIICHLFSQLWGSAWTPKSGGR